MINWIKKYFKVIGIGQLYRVGNWYVGANSKEQVQKLSKNRGTEISFDQIEMVSGGFDHIIGESDNYEEVMNMNDKILKL
jgi:hypothetical protein